MGRGRDLTDSERVFVHNKIMQNWDSKRREIKVGGRRIILKACIKGGVRVSEVTIKRIAREAKRQEVTSFSKMVLVLTQELILLKSFKAAVLETDGFLSSLRSLQTPLMLISTTLVSFLRSSTMSVRFALIVLAVRK